MCVLLIARTAVSDRRRLYSRARQNTPGELAQRNKTPER